MKNIVCFLSDENDLMSFQILKKCMLEYNFFISSSKEEVLNQIFVLKNSILVVDFNCDDGRDILNNVTQINTKQKTITLSDEFDYSELNGCEYCLEHYDRRRLLKPISHKDFIYLIDNFDSSHCKFQKKFETQISILQNLQNKFDFYTFDEKQNRFLIKEGLPHYQIFADLLEITNFLDKRKIKYEVEKDYNILVSI